MPSSHHTRSVVMLLVAAVFWSMGGVLIKYVELPPLAVASVRGFIAALFLAVCCRPLRFTFSPLQLSAAAAYAACTVTFVTATKLTTAANAILLQYTAPIYVAFLGAWLLREKTARLDWFTIIAALGGMALFFADDLKTANFWGNVVAIVSGVFFALMTVLLRKQKDGSPVESIILGNLIAGCVGVPWILGTAVPSPEGLVALLALGTLQLGVSYLLYAKAIRHVTAIEAVLIPVIEPILNPLWVLLVLREKPGNWAMIGGAIVIGAVVARSIIAIRRRPPALVA